MAYFTSNVGEVQRTGQTTSPPPDDGGWGGGSGGWGGGGYGGYGGSGPTSETNITNDTTTTNNRTNVNTESITSPDLGGQKNLGANAQATIETLINSQNESRNVYDQLVAANEAIYRQRLLENDRNTNEDWQDQIRKLQSVNSQLTTSLGNGNYGRGAQSLKSLIRTYDDMSDANLLQNQRQNKNEIHQDFYGKMVDAATDYNEQLNSNQSELMDAVYAYLTDFNSLLGTRTNQNNQTNQVETSKTSERTDTNSSVDGSHTTTTVNSTHNIDNLTTGNNKITNTVSTNISPYLDENGNIDWDKVGTALHIRLSSSGSTQLGQRVYPKKLQQQNVYRNTGRSYAANAAALSRRYG